MDALLIGGDSLGQIPDVLALYDIRIARHITGRNTLHQRKLPLPKNTQMLILLTDYLAGCGISRRGTTNVEGTHGQLGTRRNWLQDRTMTLPNFQQPCTRARKPLPFSTPRAA